MAGRKKAAAAAPPARTIPAVSTIAGPAAELLYSPAMAAEVCKRIAGGRTLTDACTDPGMPCRETFYIWLRKFPAIAELYAQAKLARADYCRDEISALNAKLAEGEIDPASARCIADNLKWLARTDNPRAYSDRVELTGAEGKDLVPEAPVDKLELARWLALLWTEAAELEGDAQRLLLNGADGAGA